MNGAIRSVLTTLLAAGAVMLAGCERPPMEDVQRGYRGTGMVQVYNPRRVSEDAARHRAPEPQPPAPDEGPSAGQTYQNVQVLGDLSAARFNRLMQAITAWVSPEQGCTYCHKAENFASDAPYTKKVARRMLQMTRAINSQWDDHVAATGVTCYTCHRGRPVPAETWVQDAPRAHFTAMAGNRAGQNAPAATVGLSSLPRDPFTPFLLEDHGIRVEGDTALPTGNRQSIKQAEWTYALMIHMSEALGVNCTYCHNSRIFADWQQSTPARVTAWYGIRMARELNREHLEPLTRLFPPERLGPTGDVAKVHCATCHQGAYKPLYGAAMLEDYPGLGE